MEADSDRQDQNVRKILKAVTISGSASSNPIYCEGQLFQKFKYENVIKKKNKPDPALLGGSYLFNEIKKRTLKSRGTISLTQLINHKGIFFLFILNKLFSLSVFLEIFRPKLPCSDGIFSTPNIEV
jgi:hypothetical protein